MCCDVIAILTGALPGTSGSSLKPSVGVWGLACSQPFTTEPWAQGNGRPKVKSPAGKT